MNFDCMHSLSHILCYICAIYFWCLCYNTVSVICQYNVNNRRLEVTKYDLYLALNIYFQFVFI